MNFTIRLKEFLFRMFVFFSKLWNEKFKWNTLAWNWTNINRKTKMNITKSFHKHFSPKIPSFWWFTEGCRRYRRPMKAMKGIKGNKAYWRLWLQWRHSIRLQHSYSFFQAFLLNASACALAPSPFRHLFFG